MSFAPTRSLRSRTYIGLVLSQFLAAFNDQAIHIVAVFYSIDMIVRYVGVPRIDDKALISIVTACFISPFLLFSTLAGMLADKFSKRYTLVFWKLAEVAMMAFATAGFLLPHFSEWTTLTREQAAIVSAAMVVSTVFMMGTHSAFFVPAKYGVMPEILHPSILSRGNGLLEGTSFVAQIMGTAGGAWLYVHLQSTRLPSGELQLGREWVIGGVLLGLAVIGAGASLLISPMPAAAPSLPLTWRLWRTLKTNLGILLRSRPLALAVLGIAFFAFMTLFLRQVLIYEGETAKELISARQHLHQRDAKERAADSPDAGDEAEALFALESASQTQKSELRIALLISMVGLGVGVGSLLAGYLSGDKVELGLVPIGASLLIVFNIVMAFSLRVPWLLTLTLVLLGIAAGLYIVPLYTLLQHRAPKESKGNLVATSNLVNVAGGLLAVILFYALTFAMDKGLGLTLTEKQARENTALLPDYIAQLEMRSRLPMVLCLVAAGMTLGILVLLCRQLPDFLVRAVLWIHSRGRYHLHTKGLHRLPSSGSVVIATNSEQFEDCMHVVAATDRYTRFLVVESALPDTDPTPLMRYLARQTGTVSISKGSAARAEWNGALEEAAATLTAGEMIGLSLDDADPACYEFLNELQRRCPSTVVPVYFKAGRVDVSQPVGSRPPRRIDLYFGEPLPSTASPQEIHRALMALAR